MAKDEIHFKMTQRKLLSFTNTILSLLDNFGSRTFALNEEKLIKKAMDITGLNDFGDDLIREPLHLLCEHSRNGKPMTALGRLFLKKDLLRRLTNKLKIEDTLKKQPEILQRHIEKPIFIVGLPRTGTTLLQRLLDLDPNNRTLRNWEMDNPIPLPKPETYTTDNRIKTENVGWTILDYAAPTYKRIHETGSDIPDECLSLMANSLTSLMYNVSLDAKAMLAWYMNREHLDTYAFHKRHLQLLQYNFPVNQRWVLKGPMHMFGLPWLLEIYPDARIIQTHRDLVKVIPSLLSLLATMHAAFQGPVAVDELAKEWLEVIYHYIDGLKARFDKEKQQDSQCLFYDVYFNDLVKHPIETIKKIYAYLNIGLSDETVYQMNQYLENNPQHKHGKHKYNLEEFNLNSQEIYERFSSYYTKFKLDQSTEN